MICCRGVAWQSLRAGSRILGVILDFFLTIIFEKSAQLVGCVWQSRKGHKMLHVARWTVPLVIAVSVTRKWKKMANKLRQGWSPLLSQSIMPQCDHHSQYDEEELQKRLEEQSRATQGKEGEHAHNIPRKWKVYNCNFQLFLFLRLPIQELALQVSKSDYRILICLYLHTTESLSRYVQLL